MADDPRPGADATFDVVVIGGGPAGSAAAVTLAYDGRSVLVVNNRIVSGRRISSVETSTPERRAFGIGEGGPPGLDRAVDQVFGAGTFVREDHLVSFGNRSCWGSDHPVDTDFMFNPFGPGWHLDRVAFDARLRDRAEAAGATVWPGTVREATAHADAERLQHDEAGRWHRERRWTLTIESAAGAREVDASIVCDATGRATTFARRHGGHLITHDRLVAAVAVYDATSPAPDAAPSRPGPADEPGTGSSEDTGSGVVVDDLDSLTTIEAVPDGWWYTAAIPDRRRVVAFFTDRDLCPNEVRSIEGFGRLLAGTELVGDVVAGSPLRYELRQPMLFCAAGSAWLERPSGPGWLATGDAAACFDPLSSQGILTAILMGRTAGDAAISLLVDPDAGTDAYDTRYRAVIDRFLDEHRTMYDLERRWPDAPFWARRHARP